jgi:hypothetical protein
MILSKKRSRKVQNLTNYPLETLTDIKFTPTIPWLLNRKIIIEQFYDKIGWIIICVLRFIWDVWDLFPRLVSQLASADGLLSEFHCQQNFDRFSIIINELMSFTFSCFDSKYNYLWKSKGLGIRKAVRFRFVPQSSSDLKVIFDMMDIFSRILQKSIKFWIKISKFRSNLCMNR